MDSNKKTNLLKVLKFLHMGKEFLKRNNMESKEP